MGRMYMIKMESFKGWREDEIWIRNCVISLAFQSVKLVHVASLSIHQSHLYLIEYAIFESEARCEDN